MGASAVRRLFHTIFGTALASVIGCGESRYIPEDPVVTDGLFQNQHRVFVRSTASGGALGGLSGADALCTATAATAGLVRTYKAVLSSAASSARSRLNIVGEIYLFTDATTKLLVAANATEFWSGTWQNPINKTQAYATIAARVWTGSNFDGTYNAIGDCMAWNSIAAGAAEYGSPGQTDSTALDTNWLLCNGSARLYCISQ